jgi:hypothetical protein
MPVLTLLSLVVMINILGECIIKPVLESQA